MPDKPEEADQILARGMTPEAYYVKLQRASLFQGALTDAVPAAVEFASLLKEPWELVQAKLDLKKSKATEKGIPLDVQDARIDAAVGKTQQIVSQQSRAISDQLAMNPSPAKRRQLLAQQQRLAATVGTASAQAGAQVGVQSAELAREQLTQEHALEEKVEGAERKREDEKRGAFLKSFLAATNIWAATRAPADFGTHLLEEQTKFEGKAGRAGEKITKLQQTPKGLESERSALEAGLGQAFWSTPEGKDPRSGDFEAEAKARYRTWKEGRTLEAPVEDEELQKFEARQASQSKLADLETRIAAHKAKTAPRISRLQEQQAGFTQQAGVAQAALAQHQANPPTMGMMPFTPGIQPQISTFGVQPPVGVPGYPYGMYGQPPPTPQAQSPVPEGWIFDKATGTFKPPPGQ